MKAILKCNHCEAEFERVEIADHWHPERPKGTIRWLPVPGTGLNPFKDISEHEHNSFCEVTIYAN